MHKQFPLSEALTRAKAVLDAARMAFAGERTALGGDRVDIALLGAWFLSAWPLVLMPSTDLKKLKRDVKKTLYLEAQAAAVHSVWIARVLHALLLTGRAEALRGTPVAENLPLNLFQVNWSDLATQTSSKHFPGGGVTTVLVKSRAPVWIPVHEIPGGGVVISPSKSMLEERSRIPNLAAGLPQVGYRCAEGASSESLSASTAFFEAALLTLWHLTTRGHKVEAAWRAYDDCESVFWAWDRATIASSKAPLNAAKRNLLCARFLQAASSLVHVLRSAGESDARDQPTNDLPKMEAARQAYDALRLPGSLQDLVVRALTKLNHGIDQAHGIRLWSDDPILRVALVAGPRRMTDPAYREEVLYRDEAGVAVTQDPVVDVRTGELILPGIRRKRINVDLPPALAAARILAGRLRDRTLPGDDLADRWMASFRTAFDAQGSAHMLAHQGGRSSPEWIGFLHMEVLQVAWKADSALYSDASDFGENYLGLEAMPPKGMPVGLPESHADGRLAELISDNTTVDDSDQGRRSIRGAILDAPEVGLRLRGGECIRKATLSLAGGKALACADWTAVWQARVIATEGFENFGPVDGEIGDFHDWYARWSPAGFWDDGRHKQALYGSLLGRLRATIGDSLPRALGGSLLLSELLKRMDSEGARTVLDRHELQLLRADEVEGDDRARALWHGSSKRCGRALTLVGSREAEGARLVLSRGYTTPSVVAELVPILSEMGRELPGVAGEDLRYLADQTGHHIENIKAVEWRRDALRLIVVGAQHLADRELADRLLERASKATRSHGEFEIVPAPGTGLARLSPQDEQVLRDSGAVGPKEFSEDKEEGTLAAVDAVGLRDKTAFEATWIVMPRLVVSAGPHTEFTRQFQPLILEIDRWLGAAGHERGKAKKFQHWFDGRHMKDPAQTSRTSLRARFQEVAGLTTGFDAAAATELLTMKTGLLELLLMAGCEDGSVLQAAHRAAVACAERGALELMCLGAEARRAALVPVREKGEGGKVSVVEVPVEDTRESLRALAMEQMRLAARFDSVDARLRASVNNLQSIQSLSEPGARIDLGQMSLGLFTRLFELQPVETKDIPEEITSSIDAMLKVGEHHLERHGYRFFKVKPNADVREYVDKYQVEQGGMGFRVRRITRPCIVDENGRVVVPGRVDCAK